jgi:Flp pilus assembly protein TadG
MGRAMAYFSADGFFSQMRRGARRLLRHYLRDRRGNIAALAALLIIPLVGVMGVATEASNWFLVQRSMQNAADTAVVAAAQNDSAVSGGTATYAKEARSVAARYGFTDGGVNNTTVTPSKNVACPAPLAANGNACYQVTISRNEPIYLTKIVGYTGTGGAGVQTVSTLAIAGIQSIPVTDCIWTKDSFRVNGAGGGSIDLNGCDVQANGDTTCNGANADGNVNHFFFAGSNAKCDPASPAPALPDPYTTVYPRTNIPADTCGGAAANYPQAPTKHNDPDLPASNVLSGSTNLAKTFCGDVQLTGDVTATGGGTMVIENGSLDLAGHTLTGTGITVIFTGPTVAGLSPTHIPPTNGTFDISAPQSGTWSGVAIYQDPNLTSGVDWSSSGNALNWKVTGLIYMPNSDIDFSGTINKATGGENCFTMIAQTVLISGTVKINETQTGCTLAGLTTLPTSSLPRVTLVQ